MTVTVAPATVTPAGNPFPSTEMVQRRTGIVVAARLSANENEFGPFPEAVAALVAAAGQANRYPDCDHYDLRHALAGQHGVEPACVYVAAGIDGLLAAASRVLLGPGRTLVTVAGTYPTMAYFAGVTGSRVQAVPYAGHRVDVAGLLAAAHASSADVVYLAEPDNPTGVALGRTAVLELADRLPPHTVLILDGAYAEYQDDRDDQDDQDRDDRDDRVLPGDVLGRRVLWLRTFSKAYGLAGLRVGYALGQPRLLDALARGGEYYAVGRLAEAAALAAVQAPGRLAAVVRATAQGRADYERRLGGTGLQALPGQTNFVAARCPGGPEQAAQVRESLAARGFLVRQPDGAGVEDLLRITIGPAAQRDTVLGLIAASLR
jgi:histidinol-phosphate aminotransferase